MFNIIVTRIPRNIKDALYLMQKFCLLPRTFLSANEIGAAFGESLTTNLYVQFVDNLGLIFACLPECA